MEIEDEESSEDVPDPLEEFQEVMENAESTMDAHLRLHSDDNGVVHLSFDKHASLGIFDLAPSSLDAFQAAANSCLQSSIGKSQVIAQTNATYVLAAKLWDLTNVLYNNKHTDKSVGKTEARHQLFDQCWQHIGAVAKRGKSSRQKYIRLGKFIIEHKWALFVDLPYSTFTSKTTQWQKMLNDHPNLKQMQESLTQKMNAMMAPVNNGHY